MAMGMKIGTVISKIAAQSINIPIRKTVHAGNRAGGGGVAATASGDVAIMKKLALHTLDLYRKEEFDGLVTSCGTCTFTTKEIWPEMLTDLSREERALLEDIVKKTLDTSELLVAKLCVKEQTKQNVITNEIQPHLPAICNVLKCCLLGAILHFTAL